MLYNLRVDEDVNSVTFFNGNILDAGNWNFAELSLLEIVGCEVCGFDFKRETSKQHF